MTKKITVSQFGHHVRKRRLANAVSASFHTITGQMTEMSQRKNSVHSICRLFLADCFFLSNNNGQLMVTNRNRLNLLNALFVSGFADNTTTKMGVGESATDGEIVVSESVYVGVRTGDHIDI